MIQSIQETLNERQKTHGDFRDNARIMQLLKDGCRCGPNWNSGNLTDPQKEALEMICHKIGRILSGNPNEPDHWKDIAGYATLVENILTTGESHLPITTQSNQHTAPPESQEEILPFEIPTHLLAPKSL